MRKISTYRYKVPVKARRTGIGIAGVLFMVALLANSISAVLGSKQAYASPIDYNHELISKNASGELANSYSHRPSLSGDGRFVAFESEASNLVANDSNGKQDIFVRDRTLGNVKRISVSTFGGQANNDSSNPQISSNGRYVVYGSVATNLDDGDNNDSTDVFLYDLQSSETKLITRSTAGVVANLGGQLPDVSADGRFVTFQSASNNLVPNFNPYNIKEEIFVKDILTGEVTLVSKAVSGDKAIDSSGIPKISCDGSVIVFNSRATNLGSSASYDPPGVFQKEDLFIAKKQNGAYVITEITNLANYHSGRAEISCDGNYLALESAATNLTEGGTPNNGGYGRIYKYDIRNSTFELISSLVNNGQVEVYAKGEYPDISADGRYIVFVSDEQRLDTTAYNGYVGAGRFVYIHDSVGGTNRILSVNQYNKVVGSSESLRISDDGSITTYSNGAYNFTVGNAGYDDPYRALVAEDTTGPTDIYVTRNILKPLDITPPIVSGAAARQPDSKSWYNHDVTINWSATDPAPSSGQPTIPASTVVSTEGQNVPYTSGQSCDPAGNCASGVFTVSIDKTAPSLGAVNWTSNPKTISTSSTVTVPTTDSLAGVASGEYYVDTDPGVGIATPMTLAGGNLTASFGTSLPVGVYEVGVRAKDIAGNWSPVTKTMLVVFDPAGSGVTGKNRKDLIPSLSVGDKLPGLISATQTNAADYGFTVDFKNGALDPKSDLQFNYSTGTNCGKASANNCHTFSLIASSFAWLVVDQANNSQARFQGIAALTIDGATTNNPYTVTAVDGDKLNTTADDKLALKVYAPGANPSSAQPLYQVTGTVTRHNGVSIR